MSKGQYSGVLRDLIFIFLILGVAPNSSTWTESGFKFYSALYTIYFYVYRNYPYKNIIALKAFKALFNVELYIETEL